jgi:hypothetical protein
MQSNDTDDASITVKEAVRQKIGDIAPLKGEIYLKILDAYAERAEEINDELPDQRMLNKEVSSYRVISIDEVSDRYEIEQTAENIDLLARAVIYEHFSHEEALRETALDEADPDQMDNVSQEFLSMVAETMHELAPYEYRDAEESINKIIERAVPRSQL